MFHFINAAFPATWAGLVPLVLNEPRSYFVSTDLPAGIPNSKWVKYISVETYATKVGAKYPDVPSAGVAMGQDIWALRYTGQGINEFTEITPNIPAKVLVNEIWSNQSVPEMSGRDDIISWAGAWLSSPSILPVMQDQWAVAVQHIVNLAASPDGYNSINAAQALAFTFLGGGYAVFEEYPQKDSYCPPANHDGWLNDYYGYAPDGTTTNAFGFIWAWNTWSQYQSKMRIVFNVTDEAVWPGGTGGDCNAPGPDITYMDRMFYVWKHYAMPDSIIAYAVGGPGSFSWNVGPMPPSKVSCPARSNAWATIWTNYIKNGDAGPHYTVTCP